MNASRWVRHRVRMAIGVVTVLAAVTWAPRVNASPNAACLTCHNRVAFDPERFAASVHGEHLCSDCHRGFDGDPHGQREVPPPEQPWLQAVLAAESHTQTGAWGSCAGCHEDVITEMARSRHIIPAVEAGSADGAFCLDCHGPPHYIAPAPDEPAERLEFVFNSCVPCHQNPDLIERWDLNPDVVFTYEESIHGRAARLGHHEAPSCVDCHQAHAVMAGDDPTSPLAPENRAAVCSPCHQGANQNFANVLSHTRITRAGTPLEYWVTFGFVTLTVVVILGLLLHMALDLWSGFRQSLSKRRNP